MKLWQTQAEGATRLAPRCGAGMGFLPWPCATARTGATLAAGLADLVVSS